MKPRNDVSAAQQRIAVEMYRDGKSLRAIEAALRNEHCLPVIRRILVENGVAIRGAGRPFKK
jgi:hypothetical protein